MNEYTVLVVGEYMQEHNKSLLLYHWYSHGGYFTILLQACAFRDSYEKFKKAGAVVVGISGDDAASHKVKFNGFTVSFFFFFLN